MLASISNVLPNPFKKHEGERILETDLGIVQCSTALTTLTNIVVIVSPL